MTRLFIPRKDRLPKQDDEAYRKELTNALAIERAVNRQSVGVSVYASANQAVGNAAATTITFDKVFWDYFQMADLTNDWLVCPESGIYGLSANGNFTAQVTPGIVQLKFSPFTAIQHVHEIGGGNAMNVSIAAFTKIVKGQHVQLQAFQNTTTTPLQFLLAQFTMVKLFDVPSKAQ